jgi:hypothetical protein
VIVVDDEVDTGGSVSQAVEIVKEHGAREIYLSFVHPVLSGRTVERLAALPIKEIVTTNTIPIPPEKRLPNMTILSIGPLLGEVMEIGNDLVEHAEDLAHLDGAVPVVPTRPVVEQLSGQLGAGQALVRVGDGGDLVERARHLVAETGEVGLAAGRGICLGANGDGVAVGAFPIHLRGRNRDEMEFRGRVSTPRRHREDDAVVEPRPLTVRREHASVGQEDAKQAGVRVLCGGLWRKQERGQRRKERRAKPSCGNPVDGPSKACERHDRILILAEVFSETSCPNAFVAIFAPRFA